MQWTARLEARTSAGEVTATELVTFSRPGMVSTLAEIGLVPGHGDDSCCRFASCAMVA